MTELWRFAHRLRNEVLADAGDWLFVLPDEDLVTTNENVEQAGVAMERVMAILRGNGESIAPEPPELVARIEELEAENERLRHQLARTDAELHMVRENLQVDNGNRGGWYRPSFRQVNGVKVSWRNTMVLDAVRSIGTNVASGNVIRRVPAGVSQNVSGQMAILAEAGLLMRVKGAPRHGYFYSVTPEGEQFLKDNLEEATRLYTRWLERE